MEVHSKQCPLNPHELTNGLFACRCTASGKVLLDAVVSDGRTRVCERLAHLGAKPLIVRRSTRIDRKGESTFVGGTGKQNADRVRNRHSYLFQDGGGSGFDLRIDPSLHKRIGRHVDPSLRIVMHLHDNMHSIH
jgi:hypothetical protein